MIRPLQVIPQEAVLGENLTTLDKLEPFQEGVVIGIDGEPVSRRRLLEAGFVVGSKVRFLMTTPFRDPLVFSLRGTSIALRKNEARCVRVRL
jgi:Fe2+ transport system protein FeoA